MALSLGLVKVSGATRCNRWGTRLEGDRLKSSKQSFVVTLPKWIADSKAYLDRVRVAPGARGRKG